MVPYKDKAKKAAHDRERRKIERAAAGRSTPGAAPLGAFRITTALDVLSRIEALLQGIASEEGNAFEKARASAPLLSVVARSIKKSDLAARIEALEAQLSTEGRRTA